MKNKIKHTLFLCLLASILGNAQDRKLRKANESFEVFNYSKAITQYENLVSNGNSSPEIYQNLGDANYFNADYTTAAKWYTKLSETSEDAMDIEHIYRLAHSLRSNKEYQASDRWMERLNAKKNNDIRVSHFDTRKNYLEKIKEQSGRYTIENININSPQSDFAPSFRLEGLIFSTGRDTSGISKNVHSWNKKRFLNLYTATSAEDGNFKNAQQFSDRLNSKLHESSTAFTKDGKTVYFTRNNGKNGNFSRDDKGISRLKLYRAEYVDGRWKNIKALPFNNKAYSVAHPALNKAENKLYFASDMPGTLGKSDIFVVDINSDGSFSTPKNLGNKINTESRETFPFITDDDVLYFASDGHPGLGGLDVFAANLKDMQNSQIINLGEPINSTSDDFSLIINTETKKGYFASNRAEGKGDDDIYALTETKPLDLNCYSNLSGIVKNKKTGEVVVNAKVTLYNKDSEVLAETTSSKDGSFKMKSDCENGDYLIVASKDDYKKDMVTFNNKRQEEVPSIELLLSQLDKGALIGTDLAKYLNIEPIYFDLDKDLIRTDAKLILDKIIAYMNQYPKAKVSVRSHTDSRASDSYNIELSQRRAKETVAYMVQQGISKTRINGSGFGETKLINDCNNTADCTEEKHQQNRRSEFILVE